VISHPLSLQVGLLASITLELIAVGTPDGGSSLLAQLTPDLIGINLGTGIGSSHHPDSEVVGGEILNSFQWNLKWGLALKTHNGPAAAAAAAARGGYDVQPMNKIFSSPPPPLIQVMAALQFESVWSW